MKAVIVTDLDGTLIDHNTYSAGPAEEAIRLVKEAGIPVCICSSKTRKEIIYYRSLLGISDPFISENGGAVFIPSQYFAKPGASGPIPEIFEIIELGTPYNVLVDALRRVREELQVPIRGFHEITPEELARKSGLPIHLAVLALAREFDEPFWFEENGSIESVENALRQQSLKVTRGGRFHHVMGNNDKGKAVEILEKRFKNHFPDVIFAGIGDSPNDIPMLRAVDVPILVRSYSGDYDNETRRAVPGVRLAGGIGPHGWSAGVKVLLTEWNMRKEQS